MPPLSRARIAVFPLPILGLGVALPTASLSTSRSTISAGPDAGTGGAHAVTLIADNGVLPTASLTVAMWMGRAGRREPRSQLQA